MDEIGDPHNNHILDGTDLAFDDLETLLMETKYIIFKTVEHALDRKDLLNHVSNSIWSDILKNTVGKVDQADQ